MKNNLPEVNAFKIMIHELKTLSTYFQAIKNGSKPFEVRKNDRDFREDDILFLKEYIPADYYDAGDEERYTGEVLYKKFHLYYMVVDLELNPVM